MSEMEKLKEILDGFHAVTSELVAALEKAAPTLRKTEEFQSAVRQIHANGFLLERFGKAK